MPRAMKTRKQDKETDSSRKALIRAVRESLKDSEKRFKGSEAVIHAKCLGERKVGI